MIQLVSGYNTEDHYGDMYIYEAITGVTQLIWLPFQLWTLALKKTNKKSISKSP